MRKITKQATKAFLNGYNFKRDNTEVVHDSLTKTSVMLLHGNSIAELRFGVIKLNHCGWETPTTKERLNGILEYYNLPKIYQKDFAWYRDIDGIKTLFKSGWNIV